MYDGGTSLRPLPHPVEPPKNVVGHHVYAFGRSRNCVVDRLPLGSSHRFRVRAENAVGLGIPIESEEVKTAEGTLESPSTLDALSS